MLFVFFFKADTVLQNVHTRFACGDKMCKRTEMRIILRIRKVWSHWQYKCYKLLPPALLHVAKFHQTIGIQRASCDCRWLAIFEVSFFYPMTSIAQFFL